MKLLEFVCLSMYIYVQRERACVLCRLETLHEYLRAWSLTDLLGSYVWSHSGIKLFVVLKLSFNVLKAEHVEMLKKLNLTHAFIRLLPHDTDKAEIKGSQFQLNEEQVNNIDSLQIVAFYNL